MTGLLRRLAVLALVFWAPGAAVSGASAMLTPPCARLVDAPGRDLAIVLSGSLDDGRAKGSNTGARMEAAVTLLNADRVDRLLLTGGQISRDRTLAQAMQVYARDLGVGPNALILETESRSTLQNALFSAPMVPAGATTMLVTSGYHVLRGRAAFAWAGVPVDAACRSGAFDEETLRHRATALVLEGVKWPVNIARAAVWSSAEALTQHNPLPEWWLD